MDPTLRNEDSIIAFESDDEFTDCCVAPYAYIKRDDNGTFYTHGDYSEEYKQCIEQGKRFVIKDEDSIVFKRKQVSKRVPVKSLLPDVSIPNRTCNVQLKVQNLEPYYDY